jgi:hypothetical protein
MDLNAALIQLEDEQTKTEEARIVPLPDRLVKMLGRVKPEEGLVFLYNQFDESISQRM